MLQTSYFHIIFGFDFHFYTHNKIQPCDLPSPPPPTPHPTWTADVADGRPFLLHVAGWPAGEPPQTAPPAPCGRRPRRQRPAPAVATHPEDTPEADVS